MQRQKRGTPRQPETLAMLAKDHRMVQKLFKEFEKLDDGEERREHVKKTCNELRAHARLEQEVFYPAIRRALSEQDRDVDLIAEAEVEHTVAKNLIEELDHMTGTDDEHFSATFCVLGDYVNHHIDEEENELFKEIRRAKVDLSPLADEMRQRREALREELGLEEAGEHERDYGADKEHDVTRRRT